MLFCFGYLTLCLWKNRPQQKKIFAFRETSYFTSLYQSISLNQSESSSVDILRFQVIPSTFNAIETPSDLKNHTLNSSPWPLSWQLRKKRSRESLKSFAQYAAATKKKKASEVLSIIRNGRAKSKVNTKHWCNLIILHISCSISQHTSRRT